MTKDEALKMAIGNYVLEKMISGNNVPVSRCTITNVEIQALSKEALEQPAKRNLYEEIKEGIEDLSKQKLAQEPVAWIDEFYNCEPQLTMWMQEEPNVTWKPLYTHPHQWQGLTPNEIQECYEKNTGAWVGFYDQIEQALRNKNGS